MRFLHLGDLHIGKSLSDFDLISDQKYILDQITDIAVKNKINAVLIAGDIYDKSIPSEAAVSLFDYFIRSLVAKKIKIYAVTGNHDSDERLNFGSSLFASNGVFLSAKYDGRLHKHVLEDETGRVNIYLMPFIKASQVKHFYPEESIENYDQAVRVAIEKSEVNPEEVNLLVAHQFVGGKGETPELSGSEGLGVQNVGLVEMVGYDCFDAFNYVALGHIHSGQKIGREEVRYSGSPLKYSLSEAEHDKSVPMVTVSSDGTVETTLISLKPKRDLRHIRGTMKQLLAKENITDPEDFIYVTLTDEDIVRDAMGIFQQTYPNTVRIEYDNSHTKEISQVDIEKITENRSFSDMISEFYRMMYGCEISEEELKVMHEIAGEAGVADESH